MILILKIQRAMTKNMYMKKFPEDKVNDFFKTLQKITCKDLQLKGLKQISFSTQTTNGNSFPQTKNKLS